MNYLLKGKDAQEGTWQEDFPKTIKCNCGGKAHLVFTYFEGSPLRKSDEFLCDNPPKLKKGDLWFHGCCAIANYACVKCLEITALNNQA